MIIKLLIFFVVGLLLICSAFLSVTEDVEQEVVPNNCKDFNGRDFLLSGGSKTISSKQDLIEESVRINWLCNGGNK